MNANIQLLKGVAFFLALIVFSTNHGLSQGGLHVYFGGTSMTNSLEVYTPDGFSLSGFHAGGEFNFAGENMYFVIGAQYHSVDIIPSQEFSFFDSAANLSIIKPRFGLGWNIISIAEIVKLRLKVLGSIDSFVISEEARNFVGDPPLNGATVSGIGGLGVSVGPARVDVEYHRGFINAYNKVEGSNFNYWLFNVGFFF